MYYFKGLIILKVTKLGASEKLVSAKKSKSGNRDLLIAWVMSPYNHSSNVKMRGNVKFTTLLQEG